MIICRLMTMLFVCHREGTFVRKGTFRVKKGNNSGENKENIPQIRVNNEGRCEVVSLSNNLYLCA